MYRAIVPRTIITLSFSLALLSTTSALAADCSTLPGTREATANDDVVRNGTIPAGTCWNPNDRGISASDESAKAYLLTLPRTGSASNNANITALNNAFAKCASKFLKDYTQRYGPVTISSAYRDPVSEAIMCRNNPACGALMNNPSPNGNHQKGLAIDVWQGASGSSDNAKIRDFAQQNPQYGVCFPFAVPGTGFYDRPHMILAGTGSNESRGAGCRGVTRACDGSNFNPNDVPAANPSVAGNPTGGSAPTGGSNNPFANPYNPTQQNQMCMVSTDPIIVVPCQQQTQQYPQPQNPLPNYGTSQTASEPLPVSNMYPSAPRFTTEFPLPTPNTGTLTIPPLYTYATTSVVVPPPTIPPKEIPNSRPLPPRATTSTQLNTDLQNTTNIIDSVGYVDNNGLVIQTTIEDTEPEQRMRTTQTFSETEPTRVTPPTATSIVAPVDNSIVIAMLTTLRNLLMSYLNFLKAHDPYGFQGSWQLPGSSFQY